MTTNKDIFHARTNSTIREETGEFLLGSHQYQVTDVGGNLDQRVTKWHDLCPIMDFVIFTVALSGYCRGLPQNYKGVCKDPLNNGSPVYYA